MQLFIQTICKSFIDYCCFQNEFKIRKFCRYRMWENYRINMKFIEVQISSFGIVRQLLHYLFYKVLTGD